MISFLASDYAPAVANRPEAVIREPLSRSSVRHSPTCDDSVYLYSSVAASTPTFAARNAAASHGVNAIWPSEDSHPYTQAWC